MGQQGDWVADYVANLVKEAGFASLPADFVEEQKARIQEQVHNRMGLAFIENLEDDDWPDYEKLLKKLEKGKVGQPELFAFFNERIEDLEGVVVKTLQKFSKEFLTKPKT